MQESMLKQFTYTHTKSKQVGITMLIVTIISDFIEGKVMHENYMSFKALLIGLVTEGNFIMNTLTLNTNK